MRALGADPAQAAQQFAVALLLWARLVPLVWLAPFLRFRSAPAALWLALSIVLTLCLWPVARALAPPLTLTLAGLLPLLVRELLIGVVYGVCLAMPLWAIGWGGELIDRLRGATQSQAEASTLGQLYLWLAVAVFFAVGGHRLALESLSAGLTSVPIGAMTPLQGMLQLSLSSARLVSDALGVALSLLLPVALSLLVAELCLALALRASVVLSSVAPLAGARSLLVLAVVLLGLPSLLQLMPQALEQGVAAAGRLLQTL